MTNTANDDEIVEALVLELKHGELNDPRLVNHVREEIRRSLARRRRDDWSMVPLKDRMKFTLAARQLRMLARQAGKLKRSFPGLILRLYWTEPPARMDGELYADACEAFDLINMFSKHPPTLTPDKPFRIVTELYHYARTGRRNVNTRNVCERVLNTRRDILEARKPPKT
jgi:hypothetical protein